MVRAQKKQTAIYPLVFAAAVSFEDGRTCAASVPWLGIVRIRSVDALARQVLRVRRGQSRTIGLGACGVTRLIKLMASIMSGTCRGA